MRPSAIAVSSEGSRRHPRRVKAGRKKCSCGGFVALADVLGLALLVNSTGLADRGGSLLVIAARLPDAAGSRLRGCLALGLAGVGLLGTGLGFFVVGLFDYLSLKVPQQCCWPFWFIQLNQ